MSLDAFGLNTRLLMAGFAGGIVHVFATGERKPFKIVGSLTSGLLVSNYLGAAASHYLRFVFGEILTESGAGFILGFSAMLVVDRIARLVASRVGNNGGEKP